MNEHTYLFSISGPIGLTRDRNSETPGSAGAAVALWNAMRTVKASTTVAENDFFMDD